MPKTPKRFPINRSKGKVTGMGLCNYLATLFETNELVAKSRKLTDEDIVAKAKKEFPNSKALAGFVSANDHWDKKDKKYSLNGHYRAKYNKGIFTLGVPPEKRSFRYNVQGMIVNYRTGDHPLLTEQIQKYQKDHKTYRDKVLKERLA